MKTDKSFIQGAELSAESASIIKMIIILGRTMHLNVTAEGVETEGQLDLLQQYGCDEVQGYFFSRPLPLKEIETYLQKKYEYRNYRLATLKTPLWKVTHQLRDFHMGFYLILND
ncbi:MAG: EAL domain-containing protein [Sporomusaceae bacterium]|nr:EAL domain-containing protein [Sporomusaceae bacterium]